MTMDAVEFLKAYRHMCENTICENCPMARGDDGCDLAISASESANLKELVSAVEQWAKDHPAKTRQSEFLKMFPNAKMCKNEVIAISPCHVDTQPHKNCDGDCERCRRDYWLQEVE